MKPKDIVPPVIALVIGIAAELFAQNLSTSTVPYKSYLTGGIPIVVVVALGGCLVWSIRDRLRLVTKPFNLKAIESLDIHGCVPVLEATEWCRQEFLKRDYQYLAFAGISGSKWVEKDDDRARLSEFLRRVDVTAGGSVEFLLLNPDGEVAADLANQLGKTTEEFKAEGNDRLNHFRELCVKHRCLKVRLYNHYPEFRMVVLGNEFIAVAPYRIGPDRAGEKLPHLILRHNQANVAVASFYHAFSHYFRKAWERGSVLDASRGAAVH
jgi:hypothetical protein